MSKNHARIRHKRAIRFVIKGIGVLAFIVMMSIPEAQSLQGKGILETLLLCLGMIVLCAIPMILAAMVCNAEVEEEKLNKIRHK